MATISSNDSAPAEVVHYSFAGVDFKLGGRTKKYETDDPAVIDNASAHPWLTVEVPQVEVVEGAYIEQVLPADDPLSRVNSNANDAEAARAAEQAKADRNNIVSIESGLNQTVAESDGPVAQTLAADETSKTAEKVSD
jgi:hypothetical protein